MADIADLLARVSKDIGGFQSGLEKAQKQMESFGKNTEKLGGVLKASLSVPLAQAGSEVIKMVADAVGAENPLVASMENMGNSVRAFSENINQLQSVLTIVSQVANGISALLGILSSLVSVPGLIIIGIMALAGVLMYLYNTNESVRGAMQNAWKGLVEVGMAIWDSLKQFWAKWGGDVITVFSSIWQVIITVLSTAFTIVSELFGIIGAAAKGDWGDMWNHIINLLKSAGIGILEGVLYIVNGVASLFKILAGDLVDVIFKDIVIGFQNTVNAIIGAYQWLDGKLGDKLPNLEKISINVDKQYQC